jgi:hypothetical protein
MLANVFSQDVLKAEIIDTLKNVPELAPYFVEGESPILELFSSQLSSILSKKAYYINQVKNENYIQTAQQPDNKYYLAKSFGYRINRYGSSKIKLTYQDLGNGSSPESLALKYGDVVGTYLDEDIIYIGKERVVERGDVLEFSIGKSKSIRDTFTFSDDDSLIKIKIFPEELKSVDNDEIKIFINGNYIELSKDLENFIIKDNIIDYSDSNVVSEIYVFEYSSLYGKRVTPEDIYEVRWIETNGKKDLFDEGKMKYLKTGQFNFHSTMSLGYNCDTLEKLSYLPIFYYKTMRRAVTDDDYKWILLAYPLFSDMSIFSKDVNTKYLFYIHKDTKNGEVEKLTDYTAKDVTNYINNYKMAGIKLYFIPAKPIDLKFDVTIKLTDPSKIPAIKEEIRKILETYTLKFLKEVDMGEILADISKIEIEDKEMISFIYPNIGMVEQYTLEPYEYLQLLEENYNLVIK